MARHRRSFAGATGALGALARRPKRVSAMVRARNEEDLLAAAVRSIAPLVDDILVVDNASTDRTPEVIAALRREIRSVRAETYPHPVHRVGGDNVAAVAAAGRRPSPHLLSTYYNWCLRRCRHPFVVKWDADMIATEDLALAWERWRSGPYLALALRGANVHPDRTHLLGSRGATPHALARPVQGRAVPDWVHAMTVTSAEARLFPRFLSRFDDGLWWCERLDSPLGASGALARLRLTVDEPVYLHLKYWKAEPHANQSPDFASMLRENLDVGPRMPDAWRRLATAAWDASR